MTHRRGLVVPDACTTRHTGGTRKNGRPPASFLLGMSDVLYLLKSMETSFMI